MADCVFVKATASLHRRLPHHPAPLFPPIILVLGKVNCKETIALVTATSSVHCLHLRAGGVVDMLSRVGSATPSLC